VADSPSGGGHGRQGFLVVEAHVNALFKDGHTEQRVYTYLPEVSPPSDKADSADAHGFRLEEDARAFESIESMQRTCRSRRIPLTNRGRGTSGLTHPFQRHFSAQVSNEAQMDMLAIAPPILYRAGAFVGSDSISFDPFEANAVNMDGVPPGTSLSEMAQQLQFNQTGRAWARDTKTTLLDMMQLVAGAYEADTGESGDPSETATKTSARRAGGQRRIVTQFSEHAGTLIWVMSRILDMMKEAPSQFLYPPIMAESPTLGRPGIITRQDTKAAVRARVPALVEYAQKEQQKIVWRMVGDGFAQIPLFAQSFELQMWYVEKMIRAMRVPESDVQEAMAAAQQGLQQAQMQQVLGALPPEVGGGRAAPGESQVNPGGVASAENLQPMAAA
jgi:hypothetical protein